MANVSEAMLFSHHLRPFFNGTALYLNGIATALADQVMVMAFAAEAINSFSIFTPQNINNLVVDEAL